MNLPGMAHWTRRTYGKSGDVKDRLPAPYRMWRHSGDSIFDFPSSTEAFGGVRKRSLPAWVDIAMGPQCR